MRRVRKLSELVSEAIDRWPRASLACALIGVLLLGIAAGTVEGCAISAIRC